MPARLQRRRTAGWRMPEGAIYVGRPTRWGNPFRGPDAAALYRRWVAGQMSPAEWQARAAGDRRFDEYHEIRRDLHQLRGHDLCCWCGPDDHCHADIQIELANLEGESNAAAG